MKFLILLISLSFLFVNCEVKDNRGGSNVIEEITHLQIPSDTVQLSTLEYDRLTSEYSLDGKLYSGYAVQRYPNNSLNKQISFINGKKQKESLVWFPDGQLQYLSNYHNGKLHGEKKTWKSSPDHILISHLNYRQGKPHGQQKLWYTTGELYKVINLDMGKELGMQKAYRKNGDLYANYEAKEGRTFGLRKASLCFGLEDENIKYEN